MTKQRKHRRTSNRGNEFTAGSRSLLSSERGNTLNRILNKIEMADDTGDLSLVREELMKKAHRLSEKERRVAENAMGRRSHEVRYAIYEDVYERSMGLR